MTSAKSFKAAIKEDEQAARYEQAHGADAMRYLARLFGSRELLPYKGALNELRVLSLQRDAARGGTIGDAAARTLERIFVQTAFYLPNDLQAERRFRESAVALEIATAVFPARPAPWYTLAQVRARIGNVSDAFAALDRAVDAGFSDAARLASDAAFEQLRSHERWQPLLQRIRQPRRGIPV
jgi:hypothetical protein